VDWKEALIDVLLALSIAVQLVCALGLLLMPNVADRLHYLAPASTLAPVLVAGAIVAREALNHQGIEAVLLAAFLAVFGPIASHATLRAARIRERGDWRLGRDESARRPTSP